MSKSNICVLIHSPLVGPLTWRLVADQMQKRGKDVMVPALVDSSESADPFWKQHAQSVSQALAQIPNDVFVTLVAHSGSGPLLPVIRELLPNPINAYIFVDAGIPRPAATRLDLMQSEDPDWAKGFREYLESGGRFPNWSSDDLREIIPDDGLREQLVAEIHPRGLDFFTEPIPVFEGWPDAPCVYILFSEPYLRAEMQARQAGWPTYKLEAGHFHMLVDPDTVADMIINTMDKTIVTKP